MRLTVACTSRQEHSKRALRNAKGMKATLQRTKRLARSKTSAKTSASRKRRPTAITGPPSNGGGGDLRLPALLWMAMRIGRTHADQVTCDEEHLSRGGQRAAGEYGKSRLAADGALQLVEWRVGPRTAADDTSRRERLRSCCCKQKALDAGGPS